VETFTLQTGAPLITGGLVFLDCIVVSTIDAATHTLFIGEVVAIEYGQPGDPLLYYNRNYRWLQK
jgi:flavin reductase (DIM6/NTAB) family NADH-FMN oxidoreductase RutF